MLILTLTDKGTVRLPKEVIKHLGNTQHLQVRMASSGVVLMPVKLLQANTLKDVPKETSKNEPKSHKNV